MIMADVHSGIKTRKNTEKANQTDRECSLLSLVVRISLVSKSFINTRGLSDHYTTIWPMSRVFFFFFFGFFWF